MNTSDNVKKIVFDPGDEGEYHSQNTEGRPVQGSKSTKDFKKVLGQQGKEGKADEELIAKKKKTPTRMLQDEITHNEELEPGVPLIAENSKDDLENASQGVMQGGPVSLFDLSKGKTESKTELQARSAPIAEIKAPESPSDLLFKRSPTAKAPEKPFQMMRDVHDNTSDSHAKSGTISPEPTKDKITTRYTQEQPDLAYVNPLLASSTLQPQNIDASSEARVQKTAPVDTAMADLVAQLVAQLYTVEKPGQTDMVIVLQYPPLFKDAQIVITSFDTAHGQLNISFQNLTQAAQKILDQDNNRKALIEKLEEKGYGVQIFQTTTNEAQPLVENKQPPQQGGRDQQREQQGGQGEGQQQQQQGGNKQRQGWGG